jgi:hypothetical protein
MFLERLNEQEGLEEGGFLVPVDLLDASGQRVDAAELFVEMDDLALAFVIVVDEVVESGLFYFDDLVLIHDKSFALKLTLRNTYRVLEKKRRDMQFSYRKKDFATILS